MTELDNDAVSHLKKRIDEQARFTRIITVLCCLSIIGCMFYGLTSMISTMPDIMVAKVMSNIENIHTVWKAVDQLPAGKTAK